MLDSSVLKNLDEDGARPGKILNFTELVVW